MTIFGFVLAILQIITAQLHYETDVFLYAYAEPLPALLNILLVVFVIASLALCFLFRSKEYPDTLPRASIATRVLSILSGVALLVCGISKLFCYFNPAAYYNNLFSSELQNQLPGITFNYVPDGFPTRHDTFLLWTGISTVIACVYFALHFIYPDKNSKLKSWFGCGVIAWHIFYLLALYFDMTGPLNDPLRLIEEFAMVAGMLFITTEIRFSLKIPKKAFWVSLALIAFTLLSASALTRIVCALTGKLAVTFNTFGHVYELVLAGYVLSRLFSYLKHTEQLPEEKTEAQE